MSQLENGLKYAYELEQECNKTDATIRAIRKVQSELCQLVDIEPEQPEGLRRNKPMYKVVGAGLLTGFICQFVYLFVFTACMGIPAFPLPTMSLFPFPFMTLFTVILVCDERKQRRQNEEKLEDARLRYQKARANETTRLIRETELKNKLDDDINFLEYERNELRAKLRTVYDKIRLNSSYRNLAAVSQIYHYIKSAVCTTLEGADGAYREYEADLRAQRICDSVELLRKDVVLELSQIRGNQEMLRNAVTNINAAAYNVLAVFRDLNSYMLGIWGAQISTQDFLEKQTKHIAQCVSTMEKRQTLIAYNEYRAALERGVDAYLLEKPAIYYG